MSASKLHKASENAVFFRTRFNLHCSIVFFTKPCGKKGTFRPQKELRRDQCSMCGFGGHIAISHDVTTYPVQVIARTGHVSIMTLYHEKGHHGVE